MAGPASTIDPATLGRRAIEVEERGADEVRYARRRPAHAPDAPVRNPAFDVTPAALVTALVTEHGAAAPAGADAVRRLAGAA